MPKRAVIVGMCHPSSTDPADALEMATPNAAGDRLWRMLTMAVAASKADVADRFDRVNLSSSTEFCPTKKDVARVRKLVGKRKAIVLGRQTWHSLGLAPEAPWFSREGNYHLLPHPSGRCLLYNDDAARRRAGLLLAKLGGFITW
jgi:hypothetical protein